MAKKKNDDKDNDENRDPEIDVQKPIDYSGSVHLGESDLNLKLEPDGSIYTSSFKLPSIDFSHVNIEIPNIELGNIQSYISWTPREQELEDEISSLKKEIRIKTATAQKKGKEIEDLKKTIEELNKKKRLQHLLYRVNDTARKKLLESEEFKDRFEKSEHCSAAIMAVDIRRSTELMLKARKPKLYANFIISLCTDLTGIILDNYGVFDKFTGDGILAFFPEFYSGPDTLYWAIKAAAECHNCFSKHYREKRGSFTSILLEVGLGIGIDYGESHLVKVQDGLTVIGTPVVYACRMSGAKAGQTLLNQPAYEVTSEKFGGHINFQESEIDMKHEGRTLTYIATLSEKTYEPKLPDWLIPPDSPRS